MKATTTFFPIAALAISTATAEVHLYQPPVPPVAIAKRDLETITSVAQQVSSALVKLDDSVKVFTGDGPGAIQLQTDAEALLTAIKDGASTIASSSSELSLADVAGLQEAVGPIATAGDALLADFAAKKTVFEAALLCSPVTSVIQSFVLEAGTFVDGVVAKLPEAAQGVAAGLVDEVTSSLASKVKHFSCVDAAQGGDMGQGYPAYPVHGYPTSVVEHLTTSTVAVHETTTAVMEHETTAIMEHETTTVVEHEMTTPVMEHETTTTVMVHETTTPVMEHETTTVVEHETTTAVMEHETTTVVEHEMTTPVMVHETTTAIMVHETTTPVMEHETTVIIEHPTTILEHETTTIIEHETTPIVEHQQTLTLIISHPATTSIAEPVTTTVFETVPAISSIPPQLSSIPDVASCLPIYITVTAPCNVETTSTSIAFSSVSTSSVSTSSISISTPAFTPPIFTPPPFPTTGSTTPFFIPTGAVTTIPSSTTSIVTAGAPSRRGTGAAVGLFAGLAAAWLV